MPRCVFQTLLRAKDNEVQYLKQEVGSLQSEVQSLTKVHVTVRPLLWCCRTLTTLKTPADVSTALVSHPLLQEKAAAYERYKEAYVERRGRCQLETGSLNEHLRLANAALQEDARPT